MSLIKFSFIKLFVFVVVIATMATAQEPAAPVPPAETPATISPAYTKDYSFAYWRNGFRKHTDDLSTDVLCFETGHFGLALDLANIAAARMGIVPALSSYVQALESGTFLADNLPAAAFVIELVQGGNVFRATHFETGAPGAHRRLQNAYLWESGRLVQHYELLGMVFEDASGYQLPCDAKLTIVVWPESVTLRAEVTPKQVFTDWSGEARPQTWSDASLRISMKTPAHTWEQTTPVQEAWNSGEARSITLNCTLQNPPIPKDALSIRVRTDDNQTIAAVFTPDSDCYTAEIGKIKRKWKTGNTDIRNYDDFEITLDHSGTQATRIPFLLYLRNPANITGLCPMLCDTNGVPTGIPVQLSKNWHHPKLGAYLRAYALLPAQPGKTTYTLRVAYGFYGTLPSASHAQLSLIGWGGHGRWEQLAIGCWGETMCFDMDLSCVDVAITDARMLMTRNGRKGEMWNWTDAGWGGDWLNLKDARNQKLYFSEMKTAYLSQGPCLTEVRYDGCYGSERQVEVQTTVSTLRTDDYARTFQTFHYAFNKPVSAENGWLFKMGRTGEYVTPKIAYGDRDGLIKKRRVSKSIEPEEIYLGPTALTGSAPWWIAFPGAHHNNNKEWGTGSRALVIRSYQAVINGQTHATPTLSFPVFQVHPDETANLDLLLTPPEGITEFGPGDTLDFEVEWITLPRVADDYYGPNESFRTHLKKNPRSWETVYREAIGNDLDVQVSGGTLKHSYPIIIRADQPMVGLHITGGVGAVPVRFDGLDSPNRKLYQKVGDGLKQLDQSVHGNDYWQTDYDPASGTYSLTFNLPLDGQDTSAWLLK